MIRSMQYIVLGLGLCLIVLIWAPGEWVTVLRHPTWRIAYTIGILLVLFMVPAFGSVFGAPHAPKNQASTGSATE